MHKDCLSAHTNLVTEATDYTHIAMKSPSFKEFWIFKGADVLISICFDILSDSISVDLG